MRLLGIRLFPSQSSELDRLWTEADCQLCSQNGGQECCSHQTTKPKEAHIVVIDLGEGVGQKFVGQRFRVMLRRGFCPPRPALKTRLRAPCRMRFWRLLCKKCEQVGLRN